MSDLAALIDDALASGDDAVLRAEMTAASGLPGPRMSRAPVDELATAVRRLVQLPSPPVEALEALLDGWAMMTVDEAPDDDPAVILPCAAVAAYGAVGAVRPDWSADEVAKLRRAAGDPRRRVREIAADALRDLLAADQARQVGSKAHGRLDTFERMSLTRRPGPLATNPPAEVNYTLDGPAHRLLLTPFPRRVRAELAGATVFDTIDGGLVHESNLLPVLYVPTADVDTSLLEATDHSTHCPFKGDASYWSVRVGERLAENAVWSYLEPIEGAAWLRGRMAFYWNRLDRWFDEDEEVHGHLRDPYQRVDVRPSSRAVTVRVGEVVVAASTRALVLSETGLPNRWYVPTEDIRTDLFVPSPTSTHCPYKGDASYWTLAAEGEGGDAVADVAWSYEKPFDEVQRIAGYRSFLGDTVTVDVADPH